MVDIGGPLPSGYWLGQYEDVCRWAGFLSPTCPPRTPRCSTPTRPPSDAVRPSGLVHPCQDVDRAARKVLVEAGLGEHFIHRTGHGIGLDVHEEPYIVEGNDLPLEVGMTFSIEPCIVFPGRWGARIEDVVAVTDTGVERLNHRPRGLTIL